MKLFPTHAQPAVLNALHVLVMPVSAPAAFARQGSTTITTSASQPAPTTPTPSMVSACSSAQRAMLAQLPRSPPVSSARLPHAPPQGSLLQPPLQMEVITLSIGSTCPRVSAPIPPQPPFCKELL